MLFSVFIDIFVFIYYKLLLVATAQPESWKMTDGSVGSNLRMCGEEAFPLSALSVSNELVGQHSTRPTAHFALCLSVCLYVCLSDCRIYRWTGKPCNRGRLRSWGSEILEFQSLPLEASVVQFVYRKWAGKLRPPSRPRRRSAGYVSSIVAICEPLCVVAYICSRACTMLHFLQFTTAKSWGDQ